MNIFNWFKKKQPKVSLGWYVNKKDKFDWVRVISLSHITTTYCISSTEQFDDDTYCEYRTLENIISINNDPATNLIDIRNAGFNCEYEYKKRFLEIYEEQIKNDSRLEYRYNTALKAFGRRLEALKVARMTAEELASQARLDNFLNNNSDEIHISFANTHHPDAPMNFPLTERDMSVSAVTSPVERERNFPNMSGSTNYSSSPLNIISGQVAVNPYGGSADVSHLTNSNKDAFIIQKHSKVKQIKEEEIVPETKKLLDKIS